MLHCRICCSDLMGNALQAGQREVGLVPSLPVVLLELVQVGSQQLAHKEEVLLKASKYAGQNKSYFTPVWLQAECLIGLDITWQRGMWQ